MSPVAESAIVAGIYALAKVWGNHNGRPVDWIPTADDVAELLREVEMATPEARKQAARERLGIASEARGE